MHSVLEREQQIRCFMMFLCRKSLNDELFLRFFDVVFFACVNT